MNYIQKIKRLYNLSENENYGFSETQILDLEKTLNVKLPSKLREYYLELGKEENLNYSYNRLLKFENEVEFSDDDYLVIYEENQVVAFWGIKKEDLKLENPPVYGNYDTIEKTDWEIETQTTEDFFLLMAVYNGTFGGLRYNGNFFGTIDLDTVNFIEKNWTIIGEISRENQKIYTNDYYEIITLFFDESNICTGAFIGSSNQEKFDAILENIDIDWSYLSYDDDEDDEDDDED